MSQKNTWKQFTVPEKAELGEWKVSSFALEDESKRQRLRRVLN